MNELQDAWIICILFQVCAYVHCVKGVSEYSLNPLRTSNYKKQSEIVNLSNWK